MVIVCALPLVLLIRDKTLQLECLRILDALRLGPRPRVPVHMRVPAVAVAEGDCAGGAVGGCVFGVGAGVGVGWVGGFGPGVYGEFWAR